MGHGGKRAGAGKPKGLVSAKTLEKRAVAEAFNQRVMLHADNLFNAQYKLAVGAQVVFRIDETPGKKGGEPKREHVLVTSPDEIKALLDEHDGGDGVVDNNYYYFRTMPPDNRALDSMLNRGLGKPTETVEVKESKDRQTIINEVRTQFIADGQPADAVDAVIQKLYPDAQLVTDAVN